MGIYLTGIFYFYLVLPTIWFVEFFWIFWLEFDFGLGSVPKSKMGLTRNNRSV